MTLTPNQRSAYRELTDYNVEVDTTNSVEFNAGGSAETVPHIVAKTLAAKVLLTNGYRVNSEVSVSGGSVDILGWGHPDRMSYAVEIETGVLPEVKESKKERYIDKTPIDELLIIEANNLPMDMIECQAFIAEQLGLDP